MSGSSTTTNATTNAQKDYLALNNHTSSSHQHPHQHLNRLKSNSNSSINSSSNSGNITGNNSVLSNGGSSVSSKRSSLIIGDASCPGIEPQPQQQQKQPIHHLHPHQQQQKTSGVSNGMFVMNPYRQTHHHNHQRGSNNNSSLSSGSSISSNMRKSYPSSDPSNSSFSSASVAGSIQVSFSLWYDFLSFIVVIIILLLMIGRIDASLPLLNKSRERKGKTEKYYLTMNYFLWNITDLFIICHSFD